MQDRPDAAQLLLAVATYLRQDAGPALAAAGQSALAYQARVAANMVDIARREITLAPPAAEAERARLRALLPADVVAAAAAAAAAAAPVPGADDAPPAPAAELAALNQALADAIAAGRLGLDTPGLSEHLWRTTLDKLAVDQPKYASYRHALGESAGTGG